MARVRFGLSEFEKIKRATADATNETQLPNQAHAKNGGT